MSEGAAALRETKIARIGLALALALFAFAVWRSLFLIDDAFISFRYARNWVEGHGPVYNLGAEFPVEGYSNFSWVVLLAMGLLAGLPLEIFANGLSVLAAAGTLCLVYRCLRSKLELDALPTSLALIALATLPSFHFWASGGLETAFFGLLLFACWEGLCLPKAPGKQLTQSTARGLGLGLLGGLLVLTRPEGIAWIPGLCLCAWIARGKHSLRSKGLFLAGTVALALPHLLWRHSFYGEWLPNTVHAKSAISSESLSRGARCLATWGLSALWPLIACAAPFSTSAGPKRRAALSLITLLAGGLAYNLLVGGDWMPFFRFLAPLSAFFAVGLGLVLSKLGKLPATGLGLVLAAYAFLPAFNVNLLPQGLRETLYYREFKVGYQTEHQRWVRGNRIRELNTWIGRGIEQVMPADSSWTGGAIGAIGYYSPIYIFGRNGLVHRDVARREVQPGSQTAGHEKRVPMAYFRDQNPTFYFAQLITAAVPSSGPGFDWAVGKLRDQVFADPTEAPLRECTYVEAKALRDIPGLPEPATLMILRHTNDPRVAMEFWARYARD